MQVKKFRAATTRAALEQIKKELGEDAFVLETKRVQSRGFLGLKSETQIEISAAPAFEAKKPAAEKPGFLTKLNLTDDTIAAPAPAKAKAEEESGLLKELAARAETADALEKIDVPAAAAKIDAVEISPEAPRLVHPRKETIKPVVAEPIIEADEPAEMPVIETKSVEQPAPVISQHDLELLRAELREVKFALGTITARRQTQARQNSVDVDSFFQVFDQPFYEPYLHLTATGLSAELARRMIAEIIPHYEAGFIEAEQIAETALHNYLSTKVSFEGDPLQEMETPVMAIIGATGVGKTTTVAKLAARIALQENRRVELVTLDTYRIAAVEQLKTYAEIIGAGCHVVRSVLELNALLRRLPKDAAVLIDTAGRSPHDLADQYELSEYLRNNRNIRKCLAIQATTHPFDAAAAIKKFELYGADCLALTKCDETMYPGALVETIVESCLPMVYICNGQRVPEDLQNASPDKFFKLINGEKRLAAGH